LQAPIEPHWSFYTGKYLEWILHRCLPPALTDDGVTLYGICTNRPVTPSPTAQGGEDTGCTKAWRVAAIMIRADVIAVASLKSLEGESAAQAGPGKAGSAKRESASKKPG